MAQKPPLKQYHGLNLMSLIYKMLAILTVIFSLVATSYVVTSYFAVPTQNRIDSWIQPSLAFLLGGGILAFTFYALAQIIDVQVDTHDRINELIGYVEAQGSSQQQVLSGLRTLINQNRDPRVDGRIPVEIPQEIEARKERLKNNE